MMELLPQDVRGYLLSFLSTAQYVRLCQVSKFYKRLFTCSSCIDYLTARVTLITPRCINLALSKAVKYLTCEIKWPLNSAPDLRQVNLLRPVLHNTGDAIVAAMTKKDYSLSFGDMLTVNVNSAPLFSLFCNEGGTFLDANVVTSPLNVHYLRDVPWLCYPAGYCDIGRFSGGNLDVYSVIEAKENFICATFVYRGVEHHLRLFNVRDYSLDQVKRSLLVQVVAIHRVNNNRVGFIRLPDLDTLDVSSSPSAKRVDPNDPFSPLLIPLTSVLATRMIRRK